MAVSKSLNRRALLRAGLVVGAGGVAAAALAGCGETQIVEVEVEKVVTQIVEKVVTKIVQAEAVQKKAVTITLWAEPHTLVDPIFAEHVPLYNKLHPHVTVNHVVIPWSDIPVKTLTSMAAGDNPDIAYNHPQLNANFAAKGVIDPLDPFIASDKTFEFDDYLEGPIAEFRWKGKVWALPLYNGPLLYVYNRDLMEQVGLGDPWELFQEGNWTIETYEKIGESAIALGGSGQDRIFADREVPKALKIWYLWNWGTGGKIWNSDPTVGGDDPTETLMHEPASLKGWDWMIDRVKDERFAAGSTLESFGGAEGNVHWRQACVLSGKPLDDHADSSGLPRRHRSDVQAPQWGRHVEKRLQRAVDSQQEPQQGRGLGSPQVLDFNSCEGHGRRGLYRAVAEVPHGQPRLGSLDRAVG